MTDRHSLASRIATVTSRRDRIEYDGTERSIDTVLRKFQRNGFIIYDIGI